MAAAPTYRSSICAPSWPPKGLPLPARSSGGVQHVYDFVALQVLELAARDRLAAVHAGGGLWMAPGGLAMMVMAPIAPGWPGSRPGGHAVRRLRLLPPASYLFRLLLSVRKACAQRAHHIGVGFAYASMPALINAAVLMSEIAAANGLNALARRRWAPSISSGGARRHPRRRMTMTAGGHEVPTLETGSGPAPDSSRRRCPRCPRC
ncbi:MAG: hypothetical protein U5N53_09900 [Mycobacterium sp.]|nr:hypothetical protein [Mycobacterium sp.]